MPAPFNSSALYHEHNSTYPVCVSHTWDCVSYAAIQEQSWKDHDRLVLRIGYNHSNNPIPKKTLSPLAPLILENHFTGGFGFRFTEKWAFDLGAIYALKNSVTYTNPSLPFGPNAKDSISAYYVYNTISYRF
jgi:long-chain fatty acid transport protein